MRFFGLRHLSGYRVKLGYFVFCEESNPPRPSSLPMCGLSGCSLDEGRVHDFVVVQEPNVDCEPIFAQAFHFFENLKRTERKGEEKDGQPEELCQTRLCRFQAPKHVNCGLVEEDTLPDVCELAIQLFQEVVRGVGIARGFR